MQYDNVETKNIKNKNKWGGGGFVAKEMNVMDY
jgi:hypothetical protein